MKSTQFAILTLLLQACYINARMYKKNIPTFDIGPDAKVEGNKIEYDDPDCEPGLDCQTTKTCIAKGTAPTLTVDKKFFACCVAGLRLLGSPETAFDCCAKGHDLVGCPETGFHCCPTGSTFDGTTCKEICKNGKVLVDGECACPEGTVDAGDGTCKTKPPPAQCCSGLQSGE